MKVTLTHHETLCFARDRLQKMVGKNIDLDFESSPPYNSEAKITSANKIELIMFARTVVADMLAGNITPVKDADGKLFLGLAEAKKYVETHFGWTS